MEPLQVLTARRAVTLILSGKAEAVENGRSSTRYRSEARTVDVPAVLRLKSFVKVPFRATVPLTRQAVLARDRRLCGYCSRAGDTIDHIVPRSKGGRHLWENVVCCCRRCNAKKDDKTLAELGWSLKVKPYAPKATFWIVVKYGAIDPVWEPYLGVA